MPEKSFIIVGAGHNGLVAAITLAQAGHKVHVFETLGKPGGAACTDRASCGCKISAGANVLCGMPPHLRDELGLSQKLTLLEPDPQTSVILEDGRIIDFCLDQDKTDKSVWGAFGEQGLNDYRRFIEDFTRAAKIYAAFHQKIADEQDLSAALGDLAQVFLHGSFRSIQSAYFKDAELAAAVCATCALYPSRCDEAGNAYTLLYLSQNRGIKGGYVHVKGGMGEIAGALRAKAHEAGVTIICDAPVKKILHRAHKKAYGVRLSDGSEHHADMILSNLNPAATLALCEGLKSPSAVDPILYDSGALKINLVLNGLPPALEKAARGARKRFMLCLNAGFDELDEAWRHFRTGKIPPRPYLELTMPSDIDDSLACQDGHHPMSVYGLYFPYFVHETQKHRLTMKDAVMRVLETHFPGFESHITHCEILSSYMIEQRWGMTHGNVDHGSIVPSNRLNKRKRVLPIEGLAICGAGSFPGGLVSGLPGYLAAQEIIGKERRESEYIDRPPARRQQRPQQ